MIRCVPKAIATHERLLTGRFLLNLKVGSGGLVTNRYLTPTAPCVVWFPACHELERILVGSSRCQVRVPSSPLMQQNEF